MTTPALTPVRVQGRLPREEDGRVREQKLGSVAKTPHVSVFTQEVLELLAPKDGDCILDATAGEGGHSFAMLSVAPEAQLVALDADPAAVATTRKRLEQFGERATVVESNFENINKVLKKQGVVSIDKALFDLGWNSGQLASGRGFSFLHDEPLNMSYSKKPASGFTAQEALNQWDEETLANVIYGYGEERYARRIAKAIVERREVEPIKSTIELVEIIKDAVPAAYRHGRLHFATRTFQALRIAVNDELGVIERGLKAAWEHLSSGLPGKGGRIAVISFHSVEDRVVKRAFAAYAKESGRLVIKKPLTPSRAEIIHNPRARSAKLRVIEKICKEQ